MQTLASQLSCSFDQDMRVEKTLIQTLASQHLSSYYQGFIKYIYGISKKRRKEVILLIINYAHKLMKFTFMCFRRIQFTMMKLVIVKGCRTSLLYFCYMYVHFYIKGLIREFESAVCGPSFIKPVFHFNRTIATRIAYFFVPISL